MLYGKDWKKMQGLIKSRTLVQIRTHAQKVFKKVGFTKKRPRPNSLGDGDNIGNIDGNNGSASPDNMLSHNSSNVQDVRNPVCSF